MEIPGFKLSLKAVRANMALTQKGLADKLGVAPETIANWETGKTRIPWKYWDEISKLSEIPRDFILCPQNTDEP